jgi:hypothetical protein
MGTCNYCGARGAVHEVNYRQNTGMLIMRRSRQFSGMACRACSHDLFVRTTLHTFVLGWWGTISLFLTPIFIISNIACWTRSRMLPRDATVTRNLLEERREYALNLLDGKDEATVIEVLVKDTGLPAAEVTAWVRALPPRAA